MTNESNKSETEEINKSAKAVVLKAEAYKTIILYASRYANNAIPSKDWKEIYGILIGNSDDQMIYVNKAEALTFGHSTDVQLDEKHYGFIEQIELKLLEEGKKDYMIGWFHSHPGLGLFFSYIDLINQLGFQAKNDDFIGLVFDHTLLGKKKEEDINGHLLTKYDTGFEIYQLSDVNMDINAPHFDSNYHKMDYIVQGLNKFFFANVLTELSTLVTFGKPLESAYGENYSSSPRQEDSYSTNQDQKDYITQDILTEIPKSEDMIFNVDGFFYEETYDKKAKKLDNVKREAEELIFEGNRAFKERDSFTGVEKFKEGIKLYKKIDDFDRVLDLLNQICEKTILNNHLNLAEQFVEELHILAKKKNHLFYRGKANYLKGYLLLKSSDDADIETALKIIQDGAVDYVKENDYAGAGMCFHKIGNIYHLRLKNLESAVLFYKEAILNYNNAILSQHPLRRSLWSKPESLIQKILELRDIVYGLLPKIENLKLKQKVQTDMNNIRYNF